MFRFGLSALTNLQLAWYLCPAVTTSYHGCPAELSSCSSGIPKSRIRTATVRPRAVAAKIHHSMRRDLLWLSIFSVTEGFIAATSDGSQISEFPLQHLTARRKTRLLPINRVDQRRIGTGAAYRGHNHYGSRKHPTLPRQKDLSRSYRIDLPLLHFLFRSIALPHCQLHTLR